MDEKLKLYTLKKLKKQIEFLRLELQETQYIFDKALTEFNSDFSDTLQEGKPLNIQKIQLTDQEEKECNILFRRIATVTHPDKLGNNSKIEERDKKKLEEISALLDDLIRLNGIKFLNESSIKLLLQKIRKILES